MNLVGETDVAAKRKISREIIILSIIVILYSFQGMPSFDFYSYAVKFSPLPEKFILARYVLSIGIRIFLLIAGIGILFRKDIFRKSVLFISLFTICTVYWKHPFLCFKNSLMLNIKQGMLSVDLLPKIDTMAWICLAVCYLIDIIIATFLIYLFTRPKIKEQFR